MKLVVDEYLQFYFVIKVENFIILYQETDWFQKNLLP